MAKTKVYGEYLKDSVVRFTAKAGENITKGQAVYISGISGEVPVVSLADADDTAKMPAFGLAEATVLNTEELEVTSFGTLAGLDTSTPGYSLGDILYVNTTAGTLTNDPAGLEATKLQNIGIVQRVHASNGSIKVGGAGRTNAVPNLDDGNIFIGDSNNKAISDSFTNVLNTEAGINSSANATAITIDSSGNVGIGVTNPTVPLQINHGSSTVGLYTLGGFNYQAKFESSDAEAAIVIEDSNSGTDYNRIGVITNDMTFITNNSESMRIDSSGSVLIGTTSSSGSSVKLEAHDATNPIIQVKDTTSNIICGIQAGNSEAVIRCPQDSPLVFNVGASETERMRISTTDITLKPSNGTVIVDGGTGDYEPAKVELQGRAFGGDITAKYEVSDGGAVFFGSTTNHSVRFIANNTEKVRITNDGLTFNGDTAAANALDDYEEGTWTPTSAATLSEANGYYTKVGNKVTVHYGLTTTGGLPSSTSQVTIGGLPFTSNSNCISSGSLITRFFKGNQMTSFVSGSETIIRYYDANTGGYDPIIWGDVEVTSNNSWSIRGTHTYFV